MIDVIKSLWPKSEMIWTLKEILQQKLCKLNSLVGITSLSPLGRSLTVAYTVTHTQKENDRATNVLHSKLHFVFIPVLEITINTRTNS